MKVSAKRHTKTRDLVLIALFAALLAVCAWISIPAAVPFTMQTFGVFLALGLLGGKRGTAAICTYLAQGAIGVPVFAGGAGGVGVLFGSTGGYMVAWIAAGLIFCLTDRIPGRRLWVQALAMVLGLVVCYALGTAWFLVVYTARTGPIGLGAALLSCVVPFLLPDLAKIALALAVARRLAPFVK